MKRGNKKIKKTKKKTGIRHVKKRKKSCNMVENFLQQVKQGPYCICTTCHRRLYQRSVSSFKHEKYQILTSELYYPVISFDKKLYICGTCHMHPYQHKTICQAVCN